jgi:hypothetical protein
MRYWVTLAEEDKCDTEIKYRLALKVISEFSMRTN